MTWSSPLWSDAQIVRVVSVRCQNSHHYAWKESNLRKGDLKRFVSRPTHREIDTNSQRYPQATVQGQHEPQCRGCTELEMRD